MVQVLKLKDAGRIWQEAINTLCKESQEGIIKDKKDRTVAVVLSIERYESYQEAQIEKAVAEMKARVKAGVKAEPRTA